MGSQKVALITGIAGGLARLVAKELAQRDFEIVGVDYRPLAGKLDFVAHMYKANYNKTKIEDVFRRHPPTHVLHLGRVGNLKERINKRFDLNVMGSRKVMDLACRYGAERLLVLSTFHIYGAHPANHIPIFEDEPLRAGPEFPQIADAIQLDNQAVTWIYRHPEVRTVLLRPTNVIGPDLNNAMSRFLRMSAVPVFLGFNPMMQFIHQQDLVNAIVAATEGRAVGAFNVAGLGSLPYYEVIAATGARRVPVPASFVMGYLRMAGIISRTLPPYLVNFFKYPCIISDAAMRKTFSWEPQVDQRDAVRSTVS